MMPGVVKFIEAKDIPGINNYMLFYPQPEEVISQTNVYIGNANFQ